MLTLTLVPHIDGIAPVTGPTAGDVVITIYGSLFGHSTDDTYITFDGAVIQVKISVFLACIKLWYKGV